MLRVEEEEEEEAEFPLECSSGSESGWTMYLENQSFGRKPTSLSFKQAGLPHKNDGIFEEEEEEEEDLSMVSDASSGPPHFHDDDDCFDENGCFCSASYSPSAALVKKNSKRERVEGEKQQQHPSLLDDTASSHVFSFSKKNVTNNKQTSMEDVLDLSIGFSATHFKAKSTLQKQYGFLQTPSKTRLQGRREE
ncbi:protein SOB FIVE-LIKE 5-like isoform X2 [Magnolia sinica]|uniref:protein SOB FIVE-LIKE 5-like isoform X2 n=1 Tax=Magnolia sinica TaxID=86752 RepID=UPI002659AFB7|nr:protein SOB FIVE-LIKE 5-like isoform X2 [Magnolia sinica]